MGGAASGAGNVGAAGVTAGDGAAGGEAPGAAGPGGVATAGVRILRDWGVRAAASVAPPGLTGKPPALTDAPRGRSPEVAATSPAAAATAQARPVVPLVQAARGVPYDARAVLGAAAAPPAVARAGGGTAAPDFTTFPVPSRFDAVVGVPLEPLPPVPVPRLHRSDDSIAAD